MDTFMVETRPTVQTNDSAREGPEVPSCMTPYIPNGLKRRRMSHSHEDFLSQIPTPQKMQILIASFEKFSTSDEKDNSELGHSSVRNPVEVKNVNYPNKCETMDVDVKAVNGRREIEQVMRYNDNLEVNRPSKKVIEQNATIREEIFHSTGKPSPGASNLVNDPDQSYRQGTTFSRSKTISDLRSSKNIICCDSDSSMPNSLLSCKMKINPFIRATPRSGSPLTTQLQLVSTGCHAETPSCKLENSSKLGRKHDAIISAISDEMEITNNDDKPRPIVSYSDSDVRSRKPSSVEPPKTPSENDLPSVNLQSLLLWKINEYIASANNSKSIPAEHKKVLEIWKSRSRKGCMTPSSPSRKKNRKSPMTPKTPRREQGNPTYKKMSRKANFPHFLPLPSTDFVTAILSENEELFHDWFSTKRGELPTPLESFVIECTVRKHDLSSNKHTTYRQEECRPKAVCQMGPVNDETVIQPNKNNSRNETCGSQTGPLDERRETFMDALFCRDFCKVNGINLEEDFLDDEAMKPNHITGSSTDNRQADEKLSQTRTISSTSLSLDNSDKCLLGNTDQYQAVLYDHMYSLPSNHNPDNAIQRHPVSEAPDKDLPHRKGFSERSQTGTTAELTLWHHELNSSQFPDNSVNIPYDHSKLCASTNGSNEPLEVSEDVNVFHKENFRQDSAEREAKYAMDIQQENEQENSMDMTEVGLFIEIAAVTTLMEQRSSVHLVNTPLQRTVIQPDNNPLFPPSSRENACNSDKILGTRNQRDISSINEDKIFSSASNLDSQQSTLEATAVTILPELGTRSLLLTPSSYEDAFTSGDKFSTNSQSDNCSAIRNKKNINTVRNEAKLYSHPSAFEVTSVRTLPESGTCSLRHSPTHYEQDAFMSDDNSRTQNQSETFSDIGNRKDTNTVTNESKLEISPIDPLQTLREQDVCTSDVTPITNNHIYNSSNFEDQETVNTVTNETLCSQQSTLKITAVKISPELETYSPLDPPTRHEKDAFTPDEKPSTVGSEVKVDSQQSTLEEMAVTTLLELGSFASSVSPYSQQVALTSDKKQKTNNAIDNSPANGDQKGARTVRIDGMADALQSTLEETAVATLLKLGTCTSLVPPSSHEDAFQCVEMSSTNNARDNSSVDGNQKATSNSLIDSKQSILQVTEVMNLPELETCTSLVAATSQCDEFTFDDKPGTNKQSEDSSTVGDQIYTNTVSSEVKVDSQQSPIYVMAVALLPKPRTCPVNDPPIPHEDVITSAVKSCTTNEGVTSSAIGDQKYTNTVSSEAKYDSQQSTIQVTPETVLKELEASPSLVLSSFPKDSLHSNEGRSNNTHINSHHGEQDVTRIVDSPNFRQSTLQVPDLTSLPRLAPPLAFSPRDHAPQYNGSGSKHNHESSPDEDLDVTNELCYGAPFNSQLSDNINPSVNITQVTDHETDFQRHGRDTKQDQSPSTPVNLVSLGCSQNRNEAGTNHRNLQSDESIHDDSALLDFKQKHNTKNEGKLTDMLTRKYNLRSGKDTKEATQGNNDYCTLVKENRPICITEGPTQCHIDDKTNFIKSRQEKDKDDNDHLINDTVITPKSDVCRTGAMRGNNTQHYLVDDVKSASIVKKRSLSLSPDGSNADLQQPIDRGRLPFMISLRSSSGGSGSGSNSGSSGRSSSGSSSGCSSSGIGIGGSSSSSGSSSSGSSSGCSSSGIGIGGSSSSSGSGSSSGCNSGSSSSGSSSSCSSSSSGSGSSSSSSGSGGSRPSSSSGSRSGISGSSSSVSGGKTMLHRHKQQQINDLPGIVDANVLPVYVTRHSLRRRLSDQHKGTSVRSNAQDTTNLNAADGISTRKDSYINRKRGDVRFSAIQLKSSKTSTTSSRSRRISKSSKQSMSNLLCKKLESSRNYPSVPEQKCRLSTSRREVNAAKDSRLSVSRK